MKPNFDENDPGIMKIKWGIAAANKAHKLLKALAAKYKGRKALPASIPVTLPHTIYYGPGGCHSKGTGILMFDGSVKNVEDIVVGDKLMGPDSTPREVQRLVRGKEEMFRITLPTKHSFTVNGEHILHLIRTKNGKRRQDHLVGDVKNITVKDYLKKSKTFKKYHKLYQPNNILFKNSNKLPLDPYLLGLLLGDGTFRRHNVALTTGDAEVEQTLLNYSLDNGIYLLPTRKDNARCVTYYIWDYDGQGKHKILNTLKKLQLHECKSQDKFIPHMYKVSSIDNRLKILAGLLDSDGYLNSNGKAGFEYTTKSALLAQDVTFIARSVGLRVNVSEKYILYKAERKKYFRVSITGSCEQIPTKIKRKKANKRKQIKNPLVFGFTVKKEKVNSFYGFTLDGDHLYLTEDFIVHHNCGKTKRVETAANLMGCSEEDGTFIRLNAECINSGDELATTLEEKLSWDGYLCDKGHLVHNHETGCISKNGKRTCNIVDPVNPRGPIKQTIVFIDEIHVLSKDVQEQIGLILLDFRYQYRLKDGKVKDVYFPKFTCFGATTVLGDLLTPLQTRFPNQIEIEYYSDSEMKEIVKSMAGQRDWEIDEEAAMVIGLCAQGVARMGENHLRGLYEAACYYRAMADRGEISLNENDRKVLTTNLALKYIEVAKYLPDGLKHAQLRTLQFLRRRDKNPRTDKWNTSGEQAICDNLGIDKDNYRKQIEPRLLARSLMERTGRGRALTDEGLEYLYKVEDRYPELFED